MKDILAILGVATMLALSIVLFMIFTVAYMSPAKAANVHINNFGEADAEMIFLSAVMPLNIISTFIVARRLANNRDIQMHLEAEYKRNKVFGSTY